MMSKALLRDLFHKVAPIVSTALSSLADELPLIQARMEELLPDECLSFRRVVN